MEHIAQDFRFALRLLAKDRRFTLAAVVALGLGIGVVTTVFATINAAMLRDLPFDEPDRLVAVRSRDARGEEGGISFRDYVDFRNSVTTLASLAADASGPMNISEEERAPERFLGTYVSANTFGVLRTAPMLGRDFLPEDDQSGAPAVIMLGFGVWQTRYGGDAGVIGKTVRVNDVPATIVGIMPAGFRYPHIASVWQPLSQMPRLADARRDARTLGVVGRLRDGMDLEQARAELDATARRLAQDYRATNANVAATARLLKDQRPSIPPPMLVAMVGAVCFVLLIAYANLANLLLARSANRAREIAIRASIGATRWRIVRQLLIECTLLATLGGVLGFVLSIYGVKQIAIAFEPIEAGAQLGSNRPYWLNISPDGTVYGFVALLSVLSALAFGLMPAWHISRTNVHEALKDGGRGVAAGMRARRWTSALLVAEIALTLILLTGAGLLWRSFAVQYQQSFVINPSGIVTMRMTLPATKYGTPEQRKRFFAELNDRLSSIPTIRSVTIAGHVPLDFGAPARNLSIDGLPQAPDEKPPLVTYMVTGANYLEMLNVPMVRGRTFEPADGLAGREGAVVDQKFADRFFPSGDVVGRRIQLTPTTPGAKPGPWFTIVGVTATVPQIGPAELVRPLVYAPLEAEPTPDLRAAIVARGELIPVASTLREVVRQLDPNLPLYAIEPLDAVIARSRFPVRLVGTWFSALAIIALVLASVGVFALTAHAVAQRTQEIGIRMALGADARHVVWMFMYRTVIQLAIGLTLGLAGAISVGGLLQALLHRVSPRDPIAIAVVTTLLVAVAGAATLLPARRAARVDPMVALRTE